jgi:serine/threonine-protein phosphatase 2B catalytic subunit
MLISMLNICSKEELEEEMEYQPAAPETAPEIPKPVSAEEREARRQIIKSKVLAIGRLSRVFSVLREESESVSELRRISGNARLPAGTLMLGAEGIKKGIFIRFGTCLPFAAIGSFDEARHSDLQNERLPPTRSEVDEMNATALTDAMERATSESDAKLEAVAKRISM